MVLVINESNSHGDASIKSNLSISRDESVENFKKKDTGYELEEMEEINDVSDSDRKAFNDMFMVFDYNGDGSVEASDVKQVRVVVFRHMNNDRRLTKTNKQAFKAASGRDIPDDEIEELIKKQVDRMES